MPENYFSGKYFQ